MRPDPSLSLENSHIVVEGHMVSAKAQQVALAINDRYGDEVEVKWMPPGARTRNQAAFQLVHNPPGAPSYTMFYVQNDEDFDERVLMKLIYADQRNGKKQLSELEAFEETQRSMQKQKWLDDMEQANDIARSVLRSKLNTYRVNENLIIKDGIPINAKGY